MANETTFVIIKPDAVEAGHIGDILKVFEDAGFEITYLHHKLAHDTHFWHRFYKDLQVRLTPDLYQEYIEFMASGPIVTLGLRGEGAVAGVRDIIGATDPKEADEYTIRGTFGSELPRNAIHASDSAQAALTEAAFFFAGALML